MKISYNWLKDYLSIDLDPARLSEILTSLGLEVEGIEEWESVKGGMKGVVVGEVLTCKKHPDADKLSVTTVGTGSGEPLHIVCGAPNVAAGQKVAVAPAGTMLYKGDTAFELKKTKIRGEISEGMICAEDELGIGTDHQGIIVLDKSAVPGTPAADYFGIVHDTVYEIGLTPNRIDSGSHFGVARDLAACLSLNTGRDYRAVRPSVDDFRTDTNSLNLEVIIMNTRDCPRYSGVTISDVKIQESPEWLRNKLKAIGLNPINNVVDITNYVQHEIGQPLHAFDADRITGKKVIIRNLGEGTKFVTLDEVERKLSTRDLMICNADEGMCIAGVFGGHKSGVTRETKNIFLESAYFNPVSIRKTSKRHGLQTDASFRFERGTDPNITVWALKRAALLIKDIAGGKISSEISDVYPEKIGNAKVEVSYRNIDRLIGKHIERETILRILDRLDITVISEEAGKLLLEIPAYRVDVRIEADVIEEILRIYGYNNIETSEHVNSTLSYYERPDRENVVNTVSDLLSANGFAEIMCNSLNPSSWYEHNEDFDPSTLVMLLNPLSSDLNTMRQTLLFGGLSSVAWNINRQSYDLKLYEFGNCYFTKNQGNNPPLVSDYNERYFLDLFITGKPGKENWNYKSNPTDFFHIKSATEMILSRLGINSRGLIPGESSKSWFSESITYSSGNRIVAEAGRISGKYLNLFDIRQDVYYSHFDWDLVLKLIKNNLISFRELPKYPSVRRDLAMLLDKSVKFGQIREIAFKTERNLLHDVGLFDVYDHESLGQDKKSYAVCFLIRDDFKTMTDKNIERVMNNLVQAFERELGAKIR